MRKELLEASSSGKNAAAKGFMGKIRDIFDRAFAAEDMRDPSASYMQGLILPSEMHMADPMAYAITANAATWSMRRYKDAVDEKRCGDTEANAEWDELEKSIVANIADEVKIAIIGDKVEMTVYKSF